MKKFKKMLAVVMAMVMLVCMMPMVVANAGGDEVEITLDTPYEMWVGPEGENLMFSPTSDGWYKFYAQGDYDTAAVLYNSEWEEITYVDDIDSTDYNFRIIEELEAGSTYYLDVDVLDIEEGETAKFEVIVTESVGVTGVEITKSPDNLTCIEGYEYDTMDFSGLEASFTLSDGTTVEWTYDSFVSMVAGTMVEIYINTDEDGRCYYEIICGQAYDTEDLVLVENNVESIEVKGDVVVEYYENSFGVYSDELGYFYYYNNIPADTIIIINYTDGTSEEVYFWELSLADVTNTQEEEAWVAGKEYVETISYLGAETTIPVYIYECPFVNVTVNSAPTREYVFGDETFGEIYDADDAEYYLYPFDITGLSFTVEYADGTTQTFDDDDFDVWNDTIDDYFYYVDAIVCPTAGTYKVCLNYKGYVIKYDVNVVDAPQYVLGDADGNGEVDVMDATYIQRILAGYVELNDEDLPATDADGNGVVDIMDATRIQRFISQIIPEI